LIEQYGAVLLPKLKVLRLRAGALLEALEGRMGDAQGVWHWILPDKYGVLQLSSGHFQRGLDKQCIETDEDPCNDYGSRGLCA